MLEESYNGIDVKTNENDRISLSYAANCDVQQKEECVIELAFVGVCHGSRLWSAVHPL
jgi:hypothetical protein